MTIKEYDLEKYLKNHPATDYTSEQLKDMRNFINASLILDDLKRDYSEYQKGKTGNQTVLDVSTCLSAIRRSLITFSNLHSFGSNFCKYLPCELFSSKNQGKKQLHFLAELRNKIGGHLDNDVMAFVDQIDPFIFIKRTIQSEKTSISHIYISLFNTGVNYVNSDPRYGGIFQERIDIRQDFYRDNGFIAMVEKMYKDTIEYFEKVLPIIIEILNPKDGVSISDILKSNELRRSIQLKNK